MAEIIARSKHTWLKEDRELLCLILKKLGYKFETCETPDDLTELNKKHTEIYEKASSIMSLIFGKEFTIEQIQMQIFKTNMHHYIDEGKPLQNAVFEMLGCMINSGLMDAEGFMNHYRRYFELCELRKKEQLILKEAEKIKRRRK